MKYRGIGTLPSSVARWLEEQLEEKGIDRVLYSRYFQHLIERNDEKLDNPVFNKDSNLEGLVDEFWTKLKEANKDGNCLKEKTNLRDIYNLEVLNSVPNLSNKYYSAFPVGSKEFENYCEKSLWTRNLKRLGKKELELSPKINQENKENVYGLNRMRSRSTVKQSGGSLKTRSSAKSLDRNDEAVVRYVKSEMKGRKCLNFYSDEMEGSAAKISRTPGRRERNELSECDLPMDFQQLLQSPDDSSFYKHPKQNHPQPNFIQSGTNLTNSIWSERMEEDELPVWEMNKWSEARSSILSSAWKWPFDGEKDSESVDHSLADDSSFFSFFSVNKPQKEEPLNQKSDVKIIAPKVREIKQEKLPTTTRTHFKPIKDDPEYEPSSHNYIDGSTFLISTTFVQIEYQRSESGGYFLGADEYEEFKRTDVEQSEGCFKPKFKLLRNEKMVQTDEEYVDEIQFLENEPSEPSCFFFPGDDQLAEDMVNSGEEDDQPMIQVNGWITTWPVSDSDAIWSNKGTEEAYTPWIYGFGGSKIENFEVDKNDDHHARLRNELTEDGEELLSDLSSIHLFLNPERMDDSNAIIQANFSPKMCTPMCPMKKGSISNELIF